MILCSQFSSTVLLCPPSVGVGGAREKRESHTRDEVHGKLGSKELEFLLAFCYQDTLSVEGGGGNRA